MKVFSDALSGGRFIPTRCANNSVTGGHDISLPVSWTDLPKGTKSFALSMVDRHPSANKAVHWLMINISPNARTIGEGASTRKLPLGAVELLNSFGLNGYTGPFSVKGHGAHQFAITVYALRVDELQLGPASRFEQFEQELPGKVIEAAGFVAAFG